MLESTTIPVLLRRIAALLPAAYAALALLSSAPAFAATAQLDQSDLGGTNGYTFVFSGQSVAQGFTVGISGTLTDLTLSLSGSPNVPLNVQIVQLTSGKPDLSQVVGSGTVAAGSVSSSPQNITVHLAVAPTVAVGEQYALVLSASVPLGNGYRWVNSNSGGYAGGSEFWDRGSPPWNTGFYDQEFETYVTPPVVVPPPPPAPPVVPPAPADPTPVVIPDGPHAGYCAAAGNTWPDGTPIAPGTFLNLAEGQPSVDPDFSGATPAIFVDGKGITCDPPPPGYTRLGFATSDMDVDDGVYPYYTR